MVASAYINRSFENLAGTSGTVLSGNSEPFGLASGELLEIQVDDGPTQAAGMNPADFADIANATAAEVAAVIDAQTVGIGAADVGGQVELTSNSEGAGSSIRVLGGSANDGLQFPAMLDRGVTQLGHAQGWAVTSDVNSVYEYGDFVHAFAEPFEGFEYGWLTNEGYLFVFANEDLVEGVFAPLLLKVEGFESGWSNGALELGALEAGSFADTASVFETFEEDWPAAPVPPGTTAGTYVFDLAYPVDVNLSDGSFDAGVPETVEDYEEEWRSNEDYLFAFVGVGTDLTEGDFETTGAPVQAESFGDDGFTPYQYVATLTNDPPPAGRYILTIFTQGGKFVFEEEADGVITAPALSFNFETALLASGLPLSTVGGGANGPRLLFGSSEFESNFTAQISVDGVDNTEWTLNRANVDPYLAGTWTGDTFLFPPPV